MAVAYVEFAAEGCEKLRLPWTLIADREAAEAFAKDILAIPEISCPGGAAIGDALDVVARSVEENIFFSLRRTIDILGHGPSTAGRSVSSARDQAVIGGPRSFVLVTQGTGTVAKAIMAKILVELVQ